jgi:hypothetical protein
MVLVLGMCGVYKGHPRWAVMGGVGRVGGRG